MDALGLPGDFDERCAVFKARGLIDAPSCTDFFSRLEFLIRSSHLVVDMESVTGLTSSGLGALLSVQDLGAAFGYGLTLRGMNDIVRLAIESAGLAARFGLSPRA